MGFVHLGFNSSTSFILHLEVKLIPDKAGNIFNN